MTLSVNAETGLTDEALLPTQGLIPSNLDYGGNNSNNTFGTVAVIEPMDAFRPVGEVSAVDGIDAIRSISAIQGIEDINPVDAIQPGNSVGAKGAISSANPIHGPILSNSSLFSGNLLQDVPGTECGGELVS